MLRRRVGGLPLQRRRAPGIATRRLAVEIAPDQVVEEHHLYCAHDQRRDGDRLVQGLCRVGDKDGGPHRIIPARHAQEAQVMHWVVDGIGPEEGDPEVKLAHRIVQHASGNLGVPVVDRAEDNQDRRHRHHHMEVGNHEHGARERNVHRHITQEKAGQAAVDKGEDEADGKEHRDGEVDVTPPQRQHPVVDLEGGRDGNDQRGGGEKEAEVRIHPADVHVVRTHHETEAADGQNRPHHHPIAKNIFSCVDTDQVGDDAEGRQRDNVDLGMAEEPEQVLKQYRATTVVAEVLSLRD